MKIAVLVARILLGLMFLVFGLNGFLNFIPAPPMTGNAGAFFGAMFNSHYFYLVAAAQVVGGLLLLSNQYVPFALTMLAAVLANILAFHLTMQIVGIPLALVATALWFVVAFSYKDHFVRLLFVRTAPTQA